MCAFGSFVGVDLVVQSEHHCQAATTGDQLDLGLGDRLTSPGPGP